MCRNILLLLTTLLLSAVSTAQEQLDDYNKIQEGYAHLLENDSLAMPSVHKSIEVGKKKSNLLHLFYAYEDAVYYAHNELTKLKYADTLIQVANKINNPNLLSKAHLGKGIIHYFYGRKFNRALDQYIIASKVAATTEDPYLNFKIKYHMGVVKSHLGYHNQALQYFNDCIAFFSENLKKDLHPALRFNNTRGLLNSLHQSVISARNMNNWQKVDSLISISNKYRKIPAFHQEKGYFLKEKGILAFQENKYHEAVDSLLAAEKILVQKNEDHHLAVTYYYLGNAFVKKKNNKEARKYLYKVDSLFTKNKTFQPEILRTYHLLLKNKIFKKEGIQQEYLSEQLLKADSILTSDFPYLSARIYAEYEIHQFINQQKKLLHDQQKKQRNNFFIFLGLLMLTIAWVIQKWKRNMQRKLKAKTFNEESIKPLQNRITTYPHETIQEIIRKLDKFENEAGFINKDLDLLLLAKALKTNKSLLSFVINEHKKTNFSTYINTLRIKYITKMMETDPKYLKLTIKALAEACGIKSRQNFSKLFIKVNGITPAKFIEKKMQGR